MGRAQRQARAWFNRMAPNAILTEASVARVIADCAEIIHDHPANGYELDELVHNAEALFPNIVRRLLDGKIAASKQ